MKRLRLRCYVCGEPLAGTFFLFSLSDVVDRVFVADARCVDRVGDDALRLRVSDETAR